MKNLYPRAFVLSAAICLIAISARSQEVSASLVAKAKQEGKVVFYTDMIIDQIVRPLVAGFEAKYGIKVEYARADSQANLLKIMGEHKAGAVRADVFGMTSGLKPLLEANAIMKVELEGAKALAPEFRDPEGYWVSPNYYVMTPAVNTDLVAEKTIPKPLRIFSTRNGRTRWYGSRMTRLVDRASSDMSLISWVKKKEWPTLASSRSSASSQLAPAPGLCSIRSSLENTLSCFRYLIIMPP